MFGIPWPLIKWGGAALAILVVVGGVYIKGRGDGRQAVLDKLAADRITILKDGKKIDEEVDLADDTGLCALLGGCAERVPDNGGD